jgi:hypothetical protein
MESQPRQNDFQHAATLDERLPAVESQHLKTICVQYQRPPPVSVLSFRLEMLTSIELHDETRLYAREIGEVSSDGVLATELVAVQLTVAKSLPDLSFRIWRGLA